MKKSSLRTKVERVLKRIERHILNSGNATAWHAVRNERAKSQEHKVRFDAYRDCAKMLRRALK